MSATETLLLTKALKYNSTHVLTSKNIEDTHFSSEVCQKTWRYIVEHTVKYNCPPSLDAVVDNVPEFSPKHTQDSIEYLCDRFTRESERRLTIEHIKKIAASIDENPDSPYESLLSGVVSLSKSLPKGDFGSLKDAVSRYSEYFANKQAGYKRGITTGFPTLDMLTDGIQSHEFVVVSGFSGTGKSTLVQHMLMQAALVDGKKCLFISLEMGREALFRKWDTMSSHFQYDHLKKFQLSKEELSKWEQGIQSIQDSDGNVIVIDQLANCTVDKVYSEIIKHQPDLVAIDHLLLMKPPASLARNPQWEQLTYITQNLKNIAQSRQVPIISISQSNSTFTSGLDSVAGSKSIIRDSDILINLHKDDELELSDRMTLRLLKNRDGRIGDIQLYWDMETMTFEEYNTRTRI